MVMKKVYYLIAAAALVITGCAKELDAPEVAPGMREITVGATIERDATKVTYENDADLKWVAGDQIALHIESDEAGYNAWDAPFTLAEGEGTGSAKFRATLDGEHEIYWNKVAFYPFNGYIDAEHSENSGSNLGGDGKMYFHLWDQLTWKEGEVLMPLIANLGSEKSPAEIHFKQAGGAVKIPLKDVPAEATSISLTIPGKNITGWFSMDPANAGTEAIVATDGTDNNTVSFSFDAAADKRDMTFYFPVPTMAEVPGLEINLWKDGSTTPLWTKTTTKAQPSIDRGTILQMPELTVELASETFYLIGYINGADYGCEGDAANLGEFKFVDGKVKATFTQDSYVFIKTGDNLNWYMTDGWLGTDVQEAVLYNTTSLSSADKLYVPGNKEITFYLTDNNDGSYTLKYDIKTTFERVFGKYAPSNSESWSSYLTGFGANGDRNVAMDDNYIYIANTTSSDIWILNKADGSLYGKVKTDGITTHGTFAFCCPRVLNLGTGTVLACTNMQMETNENLHLYVWVDGVDNNPVDITLSFGTWMNLRIGDTWTYWQKAGDPSKVLLYFDADSNDGVRTWKFTNWTAEGLKDLDGTTVSVQSRSLLDNQDTNAGSAFYVYPDNKNAGIWSRRAADNTVKPRFATASADLWGGAGLIASTTEEIASGYFAGAMSYQFFEFNNHRYISYIKRYWNDAVGGSVYALAVLEGGISDSWSAIIANRSNNLVFFASLAADEVGLDNMVTGHMIHPSHGCMDQCVRVTGDEVYITALVQRSSLCTFKLSK